MINRIISAFEKKSYGICVFLDYSLCFDTLSRSILLQKLQKYGVRGLPLNFIASYFENRKQYVAYNDAKSGQLAQDIGVIQGSKCGPLFYDIYTSDLAKICDEDEMVMFADDTCLLYTGDDLESLTNHVNNRLKTVFDWCCANKLCINPSKCNYMLFTTKLVDVPPQISLDGATIDKTTSFKYLGVLLDENLKYNEHLEYLCGRLSRICGMTFRIKYHLNLRSAKNMYFSMIYSVVTYCICIYGGVLQCTQRGSRLIS